MDLTNLVNKHFKGSFFRDNLLTMEDREERDRIKNFNPLELEDYDRLHDSSADKLPVENRKYTFDMHIVYYNSENGLFLAHTENELACGGISGTIHLGSGHIDFIMHNNSFKHYDERVIEIFRERSFKGYLSNDGDKYKLIAT